MNSLTKELQIAYEEGKNDGLTIAGDTRQPSPRSGRQHSVPKYGVGGYKDQPYDDFGTYRGPTIPNPNPGQGFDWAGGPKNNTKVAHRSHKPSFTHDGIPRYGWGDDSHDPNQHRTPVDDYNNPIPSLTPTDEEIDSMNGLQISGNPFGYSNEYIERSKALREIIDGKGYDPATVTEAQKQWIKLQQMGDIWKRVQSDDGTMIADAANNIRSLTPWRTRPKDFFEKTKELYDPITGLTINDPRWNRGNDKV